MAKTWKDRLEKEYKKLNNKIDKLDDYVNDELSDFDELPEPDKDLLVTQLTAMITYYNILKMRMKRAGLIDCECEEVKVPFDAFNDFIDGLAKSLIDEKEEDGRNS